MPFDVLGVRPPFDAGALRQELRSRLDALEGIALADKTRPSFAIQVVGD